MTGATHARSELTSVCRLLVVAVALLVAPPAVAADIQKVVSKSGIEAWLVESHNVPLISMSISFRGGSAEDPSAKRGLARILENMFFESSGRRDTASYLRDWNRFGASGSIAVSDEFVSISFQAITDHRDESFDLLRLALAEPTNDPASLERARRQLKLTLAQMQGDPETRATLVWFDAAFGKHTYGLPTRGSAATLDAITIADVVDYRRRVFTRDNLKIGVTGDIDAKTLAGLLDSTFAALPKKSQLGAITPVIATGGSRIDVAMNVEQAVVVFGNDASAISNPNDTDYYAATVLNSILAGGNFADRLTTEIREKRGLAYTVSASFTQLSKGGYWLGSLGTGNATVDEVVRVLEAEIRKIAADGPTDEEVDRAKSNFAGSFFLSLDTNLKIATTLTSMQTWNLGVDYIDRYAEKITALTTDDVKRVARKLIQPDKLVIVTVRRK